MSASMLKFWGIKICECKIVTVTQMVPRKKGEAWTEPLNMKGATCSIKCSCGKSTGPQKTIYRAIQLWNRKSMRKIGGKYETHP